MFQVLFCVSHDLRVMEELGFRGPLKAPSQSITQLALVHTGDPLLGPRVERGSVMCRYGCSIIPRTSNAAIVMVAEEDFQNIKRKTPAVKPQLDQYGNTPSCSSMVS